MSESGAKLHDKRTLKIKEMLKYNQAASKDQRQCVSARTGLIQIYKFTRISRKTTYL